MHFGLRCISLRDGESHWNWSWEFQYSIPFEQLKSAHYAGCVWCDFVYGGVCFGRDAQNMPVNITIQRDSWSGASDPYYGEYSQGLVVEGNRAPVFRGLVYTPPGASKCI